MSDFGVNKFDVNKSLRFHSCIDCIGTNACINAHHVVQGAFLAVRDGRNRREQDQFCQAALAPQWRRALAPSTERRAFTAFRDQKATMRGQEGARWRNVAQ